MPPTDNHTFYKCKISHIQHRQQPARDPTRKGPPVVLRRQEFKAAPLTILEAEGVYGYKQGMNREQVIETLRAHEPELRHRGVLHPALFGSVARSEEKRASDIDILIELESQAPVGLFEYVGITQYLADLFPSRVDVANRSTLKAHVRPGAERDAVYAF